VIPDRNSPLPLWAQVLGDLRGRLARGEFTGRFPGDEELRETYGVSRHTVREAVRRLQAEGVIERGRGRGTFVTGALIEQPLGALYSLFRSVEAQGYVQRSVVRHLEERRDEEAAKVLGRAPDEPLVYLERLRLADDQPIVLDCSWLPAALARPLLEVDFTRTALYHELHAQCGLWPDAGWERLRPVLPTAEQRDLLGLGARTPALAIERLASSHGTPVEWRHGLVRADRFSYVARWAAEDRGAGFEPAGGPGNRPLEGT
jgi:GntR family transcriptional regulator